MKVSTKAWLVTLAGIITLSSLSIANAEVPAMTKKNGYIEPFKMFDGVYYVGDKWVSSYAVKTSDGLVIIDTLDYPYSEWIPINLEKLGLEDEKVTHVLVTHGHSDHVGGASLIQDMHDAKVIMTKSAHDLSIEQSTSVKKENQFKPPTLDITIHRDTTMNFGGREFKFYMTPGHTKGDYSLDFTVYDNGNPHRAFIVGGHSVLRNDPEMIDTFLNSMAKIRTIANKEPKVSVNLSNHPHKNYLFENREKLGVNGNPFISESNFFGFLRMQERLAIDKDRI